MIPKLTLDDISFLINIPKDELYKKIRQSNLKTIKSNKKICFDFISQKSFLDINPKNKVLAFQIVKGGTGKTTITLNLTLFFNLLDMRFLCIDLDQQANLTTSLLIDSKKKSCLCAMFLRKKLQSKTVLYLSLRVQI